MVRICVDTNILRRLGATSGTHLQAGAIAIGLAFSTQHVFALGSDTVFISGTAGITYDSNVFRLDSGQPPSPNETQQDSFIYRLGVGLRADVPYSRQRFQADVNIYDNIYSRFHDLSYVGGAGRAAWLWQVGDDLSGDLGVSLSRSLQNYSYTSISTQRNIVDNVNYYFDPRYRFAPNFELQAGLGYQTARNSFTAADVNDYNSLLTRLGLAYVTPSGNHLGLQVESWKTSFPNQLGISNDYRDNRLSTFFNWAITGASLIGGSVGYKQRRHEEVEQRDFDGWTGSVTWTWVPTGRTRLSLAVIRDIGGVDDLVVTYARTYTISFNPSYQLTSKISLNGTALYQDLRFFGNTGLPGTTTPSGTLADRHDKIGTLGLGAGYQVTRVFSLGLSYTWSHRNSNVALGNYDDNLISLSGQLTF
jgi:exopolysaccharide biosynthesis operon protein EpsL